MSIEEEIWFDWIFSKQVLIECDAAKVHVGNEPTVNAKIFNKDEASQRLTFGTNICKLYE